MGVIIVRPSNWAQLEEENDCAMDSARGGNRSKELEQNKSKELEQKMDNLIRKMHMFIVLVVGVFFGCVLMYGSKK